MKENKTARKLNLGLQLAPHVAGALRELADKLNMSLVDAVIHATSTLPPPQSGRAPITKITDNDITRMIEKTEYIKPKIAPTTMICVCQLRNGFHVVGSGACLDPDGYNDSIGRMLALQDAKNKIRPLLGYDLAQRHTQIIEAGLRMDFEEDQAESLIIENEGSES